MQFDLYQNILCYAKAQLYHGKKPLVLSGNSRVEILNGCCEDPEKFQKPGQMLKAGAMA